MTSVTLENRNSIHPHKFVLWVGIGSIIMMFAGLTSAVVVKKSQVGWHSVEIPFVFWISTGVMLCSSFLIYKAQQAFLQRKMQRYRLLILGTLVLGILFIALQVAGFWQYYNNGMKLNGGPISLQFMYVIIGLHALHVLGGVIALIVMAARAFNVRTKYYNRIPVEVATTYWHFVDFLWIYLFVFLILINR